MERLSSFDSLCAYERLVCHGCSPTGRSGPARFGCSSLENLLQLRRISVSRTSIFKSTNETRFKPSDRHLLKDTFFYPTAPGIKLRLLLRTRSTYDIREFHAVRCEVVGHRPAMPCRPHLGYAMCMDDTQIAIRLCSTTSEHSPYQDRAATRNSRASPAILLAHFYEQIVGFSVPIRMTVFWPQNVTWHGRPVFSRTVNIALASGHTWTRGWCTQSLTSRKSTKTLE